MESNETSVAPSLDAEAPAPVLGSGLEELATLTLVHGQQREHLLRQRKLAELLLKLTNARIDLFDGMRSASQPVVMANVVPEGMEADVAHNVTLGALLATYPELPVLTELIACVTALPETLNLDTATLMEEIVRTIGTMAATARAPEQKTPPSSTDSSNTDSLGPFA